MKTKILILALAAFCSFSSISAGNCIDNLFNTASRMPNAEKVNLEFIRFGITQTVFVRAERNKIDEYYRC